MLARLVPRIRHHFRSFGIADGLRLLPLRLARRASGDAYRRWTHPHLYDFDFAGDACFFSVQDLLEDGFSEHAESALSLATLQTEYDELAATLQRRYQDRKLEYPTAYAVTADASFLLYALVRRRRPSCIVETGVANGHSTFFLLHALRMNQQGALHSVDIGGDVGVLLDATERATWNYRRLRRGDERSDFASAIRTLPPIDMFLHDSDHTYQWQTFEYETCLEHLAHPSLLLSDDVDHSFAFIDFCRRHALRPTVLVGSSKIFAAVER